MRVKGAERGASHRRRDRMHPGALKDLRLCLKYFLLASQPVKVTNEGIGYF